MISKIKTMKDVYDTIKEGGIIPSPKIEPCEIAFEMSDQFNALYFKLVQASEILYQFTRNQAEETKQQEETNETKNAESKLKKENPGETKDMKNTKQDQQPLTRQKYQKRLTIMLLFIFFLQRWWW